MSARSRSAAAARVLALLGEVETSGRGQSMSVRCPAPLRDAMRIAADAGFIENVNDGFVKGNVLLLKTVVRELALDAHDALHPDLASDLAGVARAVAELDRNPVAKRPDLLERAAERVFDVWDEPDAEDVVTYASAMLSMESVAKPTRAKPARRKSA